jgi:hypothetical protein
MWNTINFREITRIWSRLFEATKELKELIEDIGNV